jgi:CubicO group peptidase (beta-lactamase class C family)
LTESLGIVEWQVNGRFPTPDPMKLPPRLLLTLTLVFVVALPAQAQTPSTRFSPPLTDAAPERVGMSPERLARLDRMARDAIAAEGIPGCVILVARHGKIVYHKAFGMADHTAGTPLATDSIFRIASQTKAITSTAVMMLWEEGLFRLDDPISMYIPEFGEQQEILVTYDMEDGSYTTRPAANPITIRHLLTHTSGIGYEQIDGDERFLDLYERAGVTGLFSSKDIPIGESMRKLAALPLHHEPGERYTYSMGLDVLGYFIEVVSGMPFDAFLRERLFDPLGMDDTWFYQPEANAHRLVTVQHKNDAGDWAPYPVTFYDPDYPIKGAKVFFSGGAGLSSTTADYAKFLQMYLNGGEYGGTRFLSRKTVESIMGDQFPGTWGPKDRHYGLAFGVINERGQALGGRGSVGTFDWGGYFNTSYFADPREQLIGMIFKQTRGPVEDPTGWQYRLLALQAVDD